jgi:hypothetical protein
VARHEVKTHAPLYGVCRCGHVMRSVQPFVWRNSMLLHIQESTMTPDVAARLAARNAEDTRHRQWLKMWARIGIECVRPAARKWIEPRDDGRDYLHAPEWVNTLALADYKLRYPNARGERLMVSRPADHPSRANYHCRFCGLLLAEGYGKGVVHFGSLNSHVYSHVWRCANESLAGVRMPVAPGETAPEHDPRALALAVDQLVAIIRAVVIAWASDVVDSTMVRFGNLELT